MPAIRLILKSWDEFKYPGLATKLSILTQFHLLPNDGVLGGLIFGLALHANELHAGGIERRRYSHLNLLRKQRGFEVGFDDHLRKKFILSK